MKVEVEASLFNLRKLFTKWKQLRSQGCNDDEIVEIETQLKQFINDISSDLSDLSETIALVTSNRSRFRQIDEKELKGRKKFIRSAESDLELVRQEICKRELFGSPHYSQKIKPATTFVDAGEIARGENECLIQKHLEATKAMEAEQEKYLESIEQSMNVVRHIGEDMEVEITQQNRILDHLNSTTELTQNRIRRASQEIDRYIDTASNSSAFASIAALATTATGLFIALVVL